MKKTWIALSIFIGLIIVVWIVGRITGAIQLYKAPTLSNYPTIKIGDYFLVSNLIKPKRFDFICYYANVPFFGRQIQIHRLCGAEGDKIEIKSGNLSVNNRNVDYDLPLSHYYNVSFSDYARIKDIEPDDILLPQSLPGDSMPVCVPDKIIKSLQINSSKKVLDRTDADTSISRIYAAPWNQDNFGPVTVPPGKYFVLGDNRLNALDSRYLGFIDKKEYAGTKLSNK